MNIPQDDSFRKLQAYIWQINIERKFNTEDPSKKLLMLIEEVGELAKAVRKTVGLKFTATTKTAELTEELADVQIVLLGLASLLDIDLFDAVVKKERKNQRRTWR